MLNFKEDFSDRLKIERTTAGKARIYGKTMLEDIAKEFESGSLQHLKDTSIYRQFKELLRYA